MKTFIKLRLKWKYCKCIEMNWICAEWERKVQMACFISHCYAINLNKVLYGTCREITDLIWPLFHLSFGRVLLWTFSNCHCSRDVHCWTHVEMSFFVLSRSGAYWFILLFSYFFSRSRSVLPMLLLLLFLALYSQTLIIEKEKNIHRKP